MDNIIRLELTDEPEVPKGFMPLIKFYINDKMEIRSVCDKRIPKYIVIKALKEWIDVENKGEENQKQSEDKEEE